MDYSDFIRAPFSTFSEINQRTYWVYLWSSLFIAIIVYMYYKHTGVIEKKGVFKYLFPSDIYFHRSAINDYLFFYTNFLFQAAFILPLFVIGIVVVSDGINEILVANIKEYQGVFNINTSSKRLFVTFLLLLIADFIIFFAHYLQHKIPWLWEFHKVHHSAEVLMPLTVYRMHPVDNILTFSCNTLVLGFFLGLFEFLSTEQFIYFSLNGTNIFFIAFYLLAYNLRHSHIWVSYGSILSHIFMSPAQHQIHHSSAAKHMDKNMGFMLSIWDGLFNTLYVPKSRENIVFGLSEKENNKFSRFWSLYLMPFINLFNHFKINMLWEPKRYLSILVFSIFVIPAVLLNNKDHSAKKIEQGVYLEDMTWKEINNKLKNGVTTVLIPTGGVEQNGPHVILGKHNYIVKYTTGRIAEELGKTLVTPVVTYVPEGSISPAEGHMRFSGTLSISNAEFRLILESTARSLKQHGFKVIAFIGDSGGNQADQAIVAEKLNSLWNRENVKVIHVNDYYQNNLQTSYLINKGFSIKQIGGHAGIRDTSELMAIFPKGIREKYRKSHLTTDFDVVGADGDASKASVFFGVKMLNLKIDSAVNQIRKTTQRLTP